MSLGGTTGLPSPYPTIGIVVLDRVKGKPDADTLVHVTNPRSRNQAHVWSVRVGDVKAFEEKKKIGADETKKKHKPKWHVGLDEVLKALKDGKKRKGIVYVREEAQVLLKLEYGLSAIDSVDVASEAGAVLADRTTDEKFGIRCVRDPCND
jgi:hypothetical protein